MTFLCEAFESSGTIEKYVAGRLDDKRIAEFENHFLTCARCQQSIQAGVAIRSVQPVATKRRGFPWRTAGWIAAAASITGILATGLYQRSTARGYGNVDAAPLYVGSAVRAADGDAALFESAMSNYMRGDYDRAAVMLRRLDGAHAGAVVPFFLGASELMRHHPAAAEGAFTQALGRGESIYRPESLFYRAKARLQLGHKSAALADLRAAAATENPIARDARALLQRLEH